MMSVDDQAGTVTKEERRNSLDQVFAFTAKAVRMYKG